MGSWGQVGGGGPESEEGNYGGDAKQSLHQACRGLAAFLSALVLPQGIGKSPYTLLLFTRATYMQL